MNIFFNRTPPLTAFEYSRHNVANSPANFNIVPILQQLLENTVMLWNKVRDWLEMVNKI